MTKLHIPVAKLEDRKTQSKIVWQLNKGDDATNIVVVSRAKWAQGNGFQLLPLFDQAFRIMFDIQKYRLCHARAMTPQNDSGVRSREWRQDQVCWRMRHHCQRPIMMSKLNKLWLTLAKYSLPSQYLDPDEPKEGIVVLSPQLIRAEGREFAEKLEEDIGNTGRRWNF